MTPSFKEATNIGNQLVAMGFVTRAQLELAEVHYDSRVTSGIKVRIGDILKELGFVTEEELQLAEAAQSKSRDVCAANQEDCEHALKILRQTVSAYQRSTETRLVAVKG
jgi:hypothetical protein